MGLLSPNMKSIFSSRALMRCFATKNRKYPLDPDHAKQVNVAEYVKGEHRLRRMYVWGSAKTGALGLPLVASKQDTKTPVEYIKSPKRFYFGENNNVTYIACGFGFSLFATGSPKSVPKNCEGVQHRVFGTGLNSDSQIGYHEVRHDHPLEVLFQPQPLPHIPFTDARSATIRALSAGRAHAAILCEEDGVFLIGNNAYGQCGRRVVTDEQYAGNKFVHHVPRLEGECIVDVVCGQDHTLLLTESGKVWSSGWGADGQTGLGHFSNSDSFARVRGDIEHERIVKLACRSDFVLALNDKGAVFGWGNAEYGQITLSNDVQQVCVPQALDICRPLGKIIDVAAGGSHCGVVNDEGEVFMWGFGLLGVGPNVQQSNMPVRIPSVLFGRNEFNPDSRVIKLVCGLGNVAAITSSSDLFTWGRNRDGCLGLGDENDQYFPLKVCVGGLVEKVECGLDHTIAVCKSFITE